MASSFESIADSILTILNEGGEVKLRLSNGYVEIQCEDDQYNRHDAYKKIDNYALHRAVAVGLAEVITALRKGESSEEI